MPLLSPAAVRRLIDSMAIVLSQAYQLARLRLASAGSPIVRLLVQRDQEASRSGSAPPGAGDPTCPTRMSLAASTTRLRTGSAVGHPATPPTAGPEQQAAKATGTDNLHAQVADDGEDKWPQGRSAIAARRTPGRPKEAITCHGGTPEKNGNGPTQALAKTTACAPLPSDDKNTRDRTRTCNLRFRRPQTYFLTPCSCRTLRHIPRLLTPRLTPERHVTARGGGLNRRLTPRVRTR